MRKLLSLVLAFAMILGTFAFPVSADQSTYLEVGNELKGLGVISGVNEAGDLAEMEKLTREQALVVLTSLMGQMDAAKATEAEPGFADVPATHWAAKFVAYAKAQGWTSGVSETEFGLGKEVTTKEALSFMMRALGYTADWAKEDIMKKASELGLMEGVSAKAEDQLVRGELFIVMKNTLYTKPMGEKTELVYKLGLKENPIPETLEVVDVKAENLGEIIVEFNQEVDKDTLEDAFSSVGLNLSKVEVNVAEDGKTAILTLPNPMKNKKDYKITISKVKSLAGVQMEKVVKEFKTQDNETPKVEKFVVTGPKTFDIYFSEPIKVNQGKVKLKVDGKNGPGAALDFGTATDSVSVVEVKSSSELKDGTTYSVLVTGFVDLAGYKNIDTEMDLEYAKVTTAPTVEVVKATQEYVVLKFDRPVKGLELNNFYHTYSAWKPVLGFRNVKEMMKADLKTSAAKLDKSKSYRQVVVRFLKDVDSFVKKTNIDWHPLQVGDVEVNVLGQVGSRKVVDNWGNQLADTEIMVNVTADKTAPVIESVETSGENKIEVTFSKEVLIDQNNYEVLKADGSKFGGSVTVEKPASGAAKKTTLTLTGVNLVGKSVVLNVKNVKDSTINMNKMVGTESFNVTFGDKTFDGIKEVVLNKPTLASGKVAKLYIVYKEAMDAESATNIKNYKFTGNANVEKDQFGIDADTSMHSDSIVLITMSEKVYDDNFKKFEAVGGYDTNLKLVVSREVKDAAGNGWGGFTLSQQIISGGTPPTVAVDKDSKKEIVATSRNTIEIEFNQPLMTTGQTIGAGQFQVKEGMLVRTVDAAEFKGNLNKVIELTLKETEGLTKTTTDTITVSYTPSANKDEHVVNELEKPLASGSLASAGEVKDGVAPEYATDSAPIYKTEWKKAQYTYDATANKHYVDVEFTEKVDLSKIAVDDLVVMDSTGTRRAIKFVNPIDRNVLTNSLKVEFSVSDDAMNPLMTELQAKYKDGEKLQYNATNYHYVDFMTMKFDRDVKDAAGKVLTKDEIKVYFDYADGIKTLIDAKEAGTSFQDLSKVTKAEFSATNPDVEVFLEGLLQDVKYELKATKLKADESVTFEWFKNEELKGGVGAQTDSIASAPFTTTLTTHANGLQSSTLGNTTYKVKATITNSNGFTSVVEDEFVVTVKAPTLTLSPVEGHLVKEDDATAADIVGKVVLTLEGAEFLDNGTLVAANFEFTAVKKSDSSIVTINGAPGTFTVTQTDSKNTKVQIDLAGLKASADFDEVLVLKIKLKQTAIKGAKAAELYNALNPQFVEVEVPHHQ